jgi:hypothetical protein
MIDDSTSEMIDETRQLLHDCNVFHTTSSFEQRMRKRANRAKYIKAKTLLHFVIFVTCQKFENVPESDYRRQKESSKEMDYNKN